MSDFLKDQFQSLSRSGKRALRSAASESNLRSLRHGVRATRESSGEAALAIAHSPVTRKAGAVAKVAITSGPVVEVAKICGRAGVAGAVVDGTLGTFQGLKAMREGRVDGKQVLIHTGAEAGCGFVTSSSGTAGTIVAYMVTGTMGPAALVAGMGASLGSRYIYRQFVGETLPPEVLAASKPTPEDGTRSEQSPGDKQDPQDDQPDQPSSPMEEIGPKDKS